VNVLKGREFIAKVMGPLGLPPYVERVVVEADVRALVRVYAKTLAPDDSIDELVAAFGCPVVPCADVTVSDRGEVAVTPHVVGG
jgi:hypothetical protein